MQHRENDDSLLTHVLFAILFYVVVSALLSSAKQQWRARVTKTRTVTFFPVCLQHVLGAWFQPLWTSTNRYGDKGMWELRSGLSHGIQQRITHKSFSKCTQLQVHPKVDTCKRALKWIQLQVVLRVDLLRSGSWSKNHLGPTSCGFPRRYCDGCLSCDI